MNPGPKLNLVVVPHRTGRLAIVPRDPATLAFLSVAMVRYSDRWWHPDERLWTLPPTGASFRRFWGLLNTDDPVASILGGAPVSRPTTTR